MASVLALASALVRTFLVIGIYAEPVFEILPSIPGAGNLRMAGGRHNTY